MNVRRNNAILVVMAYCHIQETPLPRDTGRRPAVASKRDVSRTTTAAGQAHQTNDKLGAAITSVFVTNATERPRRCFLCVGRATTLAPPDPAIERLKPFYSPGDLSKHFKRHHLSNLRGDEELHCRLCKLSLDHKMHLQNHAETIHGTVSRGV
jgi:hypothetical protein